MFPFKTFVVVVSVSFFLKCCNSSIPNSNLESFKQNKASVLIVVSSQNNSYHHSVSASRKEELDLQIKANDLKSDVILTHKVWPFEKAWSIYPLMPSIIKTFGDSYDWVMFIEEYTKVNVKQLFEKVLPKYNYNDYVFLGRCLFDEYPSIIHHYAYAKNGRISRISYPHKDSGFVLSHAVIKLLSDSLDVEKSMHDFQIDVTYEFAKMLREKHQVDLTCVSEFCGPQGQFDNCVTTVQFHSLNCGSITSIDDVQFAVKTTEKFHKSRAVVVKQTWGVYPKHITYYSNVTDKTIPTIDCGVPNTETGHCGKMEAILLDMKYNPELKDCKWLVIADDDTILSVARLLKLLSCYDGNMPIVAGDRYGFGLTSAGEDGYSYITGGGGIAMSRKAVDEWFAQGCTCPSSDTPDDMYLGICFTKVVGIPVVHSHLFHQARPEDYDPLILENQNPVSFHRYGEQYGEEDSHQVYKEWFEKADLNEFSSSITVSTTPAPAVLVEPTPTPGPEPTFGSPKDEL